MEKAILVKDISELDSFDPEKFSRIYIGDEFCFNLMPSKDEIRRYSDFCTKNCLGLTLQTPPIDQSQLKAVNELLDKLVSLPSELRIEVVINDWGMVDEMKKRGIASGLGRLLARQEKGPRIKNIVNKISGHQLKALKQVPAEFEIEYLKKGNISRIELDNPLHGVAYEGGLPASLHLPFVHLSTRMECPFSGNCKKQCLKKKRLLSHPQFPVDLIQRGNSFFYKNKDTSSVESGAIDRLVISKSP